MQTEDPTNKDLLHFIQDIQGKVADIKEHDLPEINARVKTTNGSVAEVIKWKERLTGAGFVGLIVVIPLLTWAIYQISTWPDKLQSALAPYELPNKK